MNGCRSTIGAICGAVAGAYWGVPRGIIDATSIFLDEKMKTMLAACEKQWLE